MNKFNMINVNNINIIKKKQLTIKKMSIKEKKNFCNFR